MNTVNKLHQVRPGIISVLVMSACLNAALLGTVPISHCRAFFASPVPAPSKIVSWHLHFCHISVFLLVESEGIAELLRYEIDDQVTAFLKFVPCQSFIFWRFAIDLLLFILFFFFFLIHHFLASHLFSSESCCLYCKWPFRTLSTARIMCLFG